MSSEAPVRTPVADKVVKAPVEGVVAPTGEESMFAPSMLRATLVPDAEKIASIVSRSLFNFVIVNLFMIYFL